MEASRRDIGRYTIAPEWVLDAEISDRAVRLYTVLGIYADRASGESWPSRTKLSDRLRCSLKSIDRAMDELEDIGAVRVSERLGEDGRQKSNLYTVYTAPRGISLTREVVTGDEGEVVTGDAQNKNQNEREGSASHSLAVASPETPLRGPKSVDRRPVTDEERELSIAVLAAWNQHAGQDLRSDEWLAKIIMRIREYPEATLADHDFVIRANLADPWWRGPSNPSVVYGSGAQFERSVTKARATLNEGDADERLERIVAEATGRSAA